MQPRNPFAGLGVAWRGKGLVRASLLLVAAAVVAAVASAFGIAHDYGYLHASILTGSPGGQYHALATRLADRAKREHGTLIVIPTAGSIENISRLANNRGGCAEKFALVQDGTPVPADARLELLGRLPEPESLLLLGRPGHAFHSFADLRGALIGIGPEGSGTAYLMQQLFEDPDLQELDVHLSHHELLEQAELVARSKLDLAALVIQEDAELLRTIIRQHGLDIISPQDLQGLIARYPWLSLGRIPAGRYDVVRPLPAVDKQVARLGTLVIASPCAQRADRIALLMLLAAELPGFVRGNPPSSTSSATVLPLAPEARQFFLTGAPEIADRYFPWLVNLMSPAYGYGGDHPFQCVESIQPISPMADRCGPREARDGPQGACRSQTHPRTNACSSSRAGDGRTGEARRRPGNPGAIGGTARPLPASDKFPCHPHGR